MNISEDIKPISYLKSHSAEILKNINENHRPIIITQNGEPKGVFIDADSYQNMLKTINLLKLISLSEKDIDNKNITDQKSFFNKVDEEYFQ